MEVYQQTNDDKNKSKLITMNTLPTVLVRLGISGFGILEIKTWISDR